MVELAETKRPLSSMSSSKNAVSMTFTRFVFAERVPANRGRSVDGLPGRESLIGLRPRIPGAADLVEVRVVDVAVVPEEDVDVLALRCRSAARVCRPPVGGSSLSQLGPGLVPDAHEVRRIEVQDVRHAGGRDDEARALILRSVRQDVTVRNDLRGGPRAVGAHASGT